MAYYTIRSAVNSNYVAIQNYDGYVSNNQNVGLIATTNNDLARNIHIWSIDTLGTGVFARAYVNTAYGLNVYHVHLLFLQYV